MKISLEKKTLSFYIWSLVPLLALAFVGWLLTDKWQQATARSNFMAAHRSSRDAAYVEIPPMTVSFSSLSSKHMQVDITLEVEKKDAQILEGYLPQIMDRLNVYLPKVDMGNINKPDAMFMLHKEMLWQINSIGIPVKVHDVVLQNLVIM